ASGRRVVLTESRLLGVGGVGGGGGGAAQGEDLLAAATGRRGGFLGRGDRGGQLVQLPVVGGGEPVDLLAPGGVVPPAQRVDARVGVPADASHAVGDEAVDLIVGGGDDGAGPVEELLPGGVGAAGAEGGAEDPADDGAETGGDHAADQGAGCGSAAGAPVVAGHEGGADRGQGLVDAGEVGCGRFGPVHGGGRGRGRGLPGQSGEPVVLAAEVLGEFPGGLGEQFTGASDGGPHLLFGPFAQVQPDEAGHLLGGLGGVVDLVARDGVVDVGRQLLPGGGQDVGRRREEGVGADAAAGASGPAVQELGEVGEGEGGQFGAGAGEFGPAAVGGLLDRGEQVGEQAVHGGGHGGPAPVGGQPYDLGLDVQERRKVARAAGAGAWSGAVGGGRGEGFGQGPAGGARQQDGVGEAEFAQPVGHDLDGLGVFVLV